ncbi:temptin-like [Biomphalaria glabrata]|uniref:Temptin-like n=1 Tax=Biomphalaria glabrata TaxID=6526 RepID=A0A9W3ARH7_BIOGL|nr:temptin-like [Biomphalaria glabrata]
MYFTILSFVSFLAAASCYPRYTTLIPNGDIVPNPCLIGLWQGVGHYNSSGGGATNEFGLDFAAAGHVWSQELCLKDSDRDGLTNGQELGDPGCRFATSNPGHLVAPQSHPGICEPIGSNKCAWQTFRC